MKTRVLILHQHDPFIHHVGGVGTFINTFLRHAPEDFEVRLVGVSTDPQKRPVGKWQSTRLNGNTFDFLPIVHAHPTYHGRFPLSIRFAWALRQFRRLINFQDSILELHRIETELALKDISQMKVLFYHTHPKDIYHPQTENHWRRFPALYFWLERRLLKNIHQLYGVREDLIDWYRQQYPQFKQPFIFLPTWVDEDIFQSVSEGERTTLRLRFEKEYGIKSGSRILLFVGRFERQKDPEMLLEAFRLLNQQIPETELVLIGGGSLEPDLRKSIARNQMEDRIHLLGPQSQASIAQWMNIADSLCLSSVYEGMPRVVLEALQCGLPVVTTDQGEVKRLIQHPTAGRIVLEHTAESFSSACADLLSQPRDRQACQKMVEPFRANQVLNYLFSTYRDLKEIKS